MWLFSSLQISKQLARLETNKSTKLATAITAHTSNSKEILCVVWNQVAWKLFRANFISEGLSKDIKILHKTHTHLQSMTKKSEKSAIFLEVLRSTSYEIFVPTKEEHQWAKGTSDQ